MKMSVFNDRWELKEPFVTSKESIDHIETITVCLGGDGPCGRGEALGVDYHGEDAASMRAQLEDVREAVESGLSQEQAQALLPPGGARNALDCAMWDLQARQSGQRVHEMLDIPFNPVVTAYTLSLDRPDRMAQEAVAYAAFPLLKLKLNENEIVDSLEAIRTARPDASLVIDANCAWSVQTLDQVADDLVRLNISMVEQPLPPEADHALEGLEYPVTLCADESCQTMKDMETVAARYDMANIKLDKSGGLTEAMKMVNWCRENNIELMVGNMLGSSLAMAPGILVAQFCTFVDLDGPLWQTSDRKSALNYDGAVVQPPDPALWG